MFIGLPPNVAQRPYALVEQMVDIRMNRSEVMLGSGGTFLSGMRWCISIAMRYVLMEIGGGGECVQRGGRLNLRLVEIICTSTVE